ncbi:MAG: RNA-binding cell elongation regulator Jag/EloR [Acutalibacteraceae bacterium]|nr:protein jag [Bacillota bacterium]
MKEIIVTGATIEEAVENGCAELEVDRDVVEYDVLEMPQAKKFGLFGGAPAKVRVFVKDSPTEVAINYLKEILESMGVRDLEITEEVTDERTILNINGNDDDMGVVIGRRGETLTALQYLVSLAANNVCEEYFKVSLNVKNFREKREKTLEIVASKTAYKANKLQKNIALEPMSPYERSIIHTAVQAIDGVTSWSVGENEKRHVVIGPEGLDEGSDGIPAKYAKLNTNSRRGGYNKGGRGGYNKGGYNKGGRYNRSSGNRGGYNKGGYRKKSYRDNQESGYSRSSYNRYDSENTAPSKPKSDYNSGYLYGRIDVKKDDNSGSDE